MTLAGDIGGASLVLRIKRVEVLIEAFLGGFAGVDGAADAGRGHGFEVLVRPKKRGPDQWAPVICRAMAESER